MLEFHDFDSIIVDDTTLTNKEQDCDYENAFAMDIPRMTKLKAMQVKFVDFLTQDYGKRTILEDKNDEKGIIAWLDINRTLFLEKALLPQQSHLEAYRRYATHIFNNIVPKMKPNLVDCANQRYAMANKIYGKGQEMSRTRQQHEDAIYNQSKLLNIDDEFLSMSKDLGELIPAETIESKLDVARLIKGFKERVHPVENEYSSALFSSSVYREEIEAKTKCRIISVYPLLAERQTPWFDTNPFF